MGPILAAGAPPRPSLLQGMLAVPRLLLFAGAKDAAGVREDDVPGGTVGDVLDAAIIRYGPAFEALLPTCAVWIDGEPAARTDVVPPGAEVAVLPPVSGG